MLDLGPIFNESILLYSLAIYFFFWLWNYSDILERSRKYFLEKFLTKFPKIEYATSCSFCFTFWISLIGVIFLGISPVFVITAPLVNLFIDLLYNRLK